MQVYLRHMELPPYLLSHKRVFFQPALFLLHLLLAWLVSVYVVSYQMPVMPLLTAPVSHPVLLNAPSCCSRQNCEVQSQLISVAMLLGSTFADDVVVADCDRPQYPLNKRSPCMRVTHLFFLSVVYPWMTVLWTRKNLQCRTMH